MILSMAASLTFVGWWHRTTLVQDVGSLLIEQRAFLGRFQSIIFAELDGPRQRAIDVQIRSRATVVQRVIIAGGIPRHFSLTRMEL